MTDKVRQLLKVRIEEIERPYNFLALFQGGQTPITELITKIGPETNLKDLTSFALITQLEKDNLGDLDRKIAELKAQNISTQIEILSKKINDLEYLCYHLRDIENQLGEDAVAQISTDVSSYLQADIKAKQLSVDQFKSERFKQTGTDAWYQFIRAAKALADMRERPRTHILKRVIIASFAANPFQRRLVDYWSSCGIS